MFENQSNGSLIAGLQGQGMISLTSDQIRDTIEQLRLVREFIYHELRDGSDYGCVSGCGDKPTLLQPGAQKICMFFNVYPEYEVERKDVEQGHLDYVVKTTLVSRTTGLKVGSGVGSCSSLEKKFRYRQQNRLCPKCGAEAIRVSKAGGFFCGVRSGGCGASFGAKDVGIVDQKTGLVQNEDVADTFNTVLKMAKKRSFVDATLSLSCISEFFTQDLEDGGNLQPVSRPLPEVGGRRKGSEGKELTPERQEVSPACPTPDYEPDPSLNWLEHAHVVEYNRRFEEIVTLSLTRHTDREPACRSFIKNEWIKLTRERNLEVRPDRISGAAFDQCAAEWELRVTRTMHLKKSAEKGSRRSTRARAA